MPICLTVWKITVVAGQEKGKRGKVCEKHNEVRQEAGWEGKKERERKKLKETDVENLLAMDECGW